MAIPVYNYPGPQTACYAAVNQVRVALNTQGNGADLTNSADDSLILWFLEAASRRIDQYCSRKFYPRIQSYKYDWRGQTLELAFGEDLLSLTTLTNGNGAVIAATGSNGLANYFLYPANQWPKFKLQLAINQSLAWTYINTPQQAISVAGVWGYPEDVITGIYQVPVAGATSVNAQLAADTTLTVAANKVFAGQTLYIGTEFILVQSVTTGSVNDTLTVARGMFGSTAASIGAGAAINVVVYNPVVVRSAYRLAAWYYRQKDSQVFDTLALPSLGQLVLPAGMPKDVIQELSTLQKRRIGMKS